jgi:hypothetical protein
MSAADIAARVRRLNQLGRGLMNVAFERGFGQGRFYLAFDAFGR